MPSLVINGKKTMLGELKIQGSKNSALPIIAAALLTNERINLYNCPDILDIRDMIKILCSLGVECIFDDNILSISAKSCDGDMDYELCRNFRASSLLMGAMLGRRNSFKIVKPGGCNIGSRPIDIHLDGFRQLGTSICEKEDYIFGTRVINHGGEYTLRYPSVGATQNLILSTVIGSGDTILHNCAIEPEVYDLCDFLNTMGANIRILSHRTIKITGVGELHGCSYSIKGDRIVAGTYLIGCAMTGGNVKLTDVEPKRLATEIDLLRKTGCHIFTDEKNNAIILIADLESNDRKRAVPIVITGPYPDFSTDLQPQMMAYCSIANGITLIYDSVFESRYCLATALKKMGANIRINNDSALVYGRKELKPGCFVACDLRQGAALVLAGLASVGTTIIRECQHIMRGYEDIARDLRRLGADIEWMTENI